MSAHGKKQRKQKKEEEALSPLKRNNFDEFAFHSTNFWSLHFVVVAAASRFLYFFLSSSSSSLRLFAACLSVLRFKSAAWISTVNNLTNEIVSLLARVCARARPKSLHYFHFSNKHAIRKLWAEFLNSKEISLRCVATALCCSVRYLVAVLISDKRIFYMILVFWFWGQIYTILLFSTEFLFNFHSPCEMRMKWSGGGKTLHWNCVYSNRST